MFQFITFLYRIFFLASFLFLSSYCVSQDWTRFARIAGHGLNMNTIPGIMDDARQTLLFGIEVDNDIPGRYESFLDPTEKLYAIKAMADSAHANHNYVFVYVAGTECITYNANSREHTLFKDHPDWVQRDRDGNPAIFTGGDAFWIAEGDEDVWISPYALEWRKIYMERIRQIAATGIDGIYVDIPYWMAHFKGWEERWVSFDKYTVEHFKRKTGIDALKDFELGDWSDPKFIRWVDFRMETITDFIREIHDNVKSVNPNCKTIMEIWPGLNSYVMRVGTDNYRIAQVTDIIAHETSPGRSAASSTPLEWMNYMARMFTFRAFAGSNPSWMLSYSWDGEEKIHPSDAMKNLFMTQVMSGTNSWDASRHVMSGSNDYATRTAVYKWIRDNEKVIYADRKPISPLGVYFSPKTRDYFFEEWNQSYFGTMQFLLNNNIEFEIVTPRTLSSSKSNVIIFPDIKCLSTDEFSEISALSAKGKTIVFTGETGYYTEKREKLGANRLNNLISKRPNTFYFNDKPEVAYFKFMSLNYDDFVFNDTGGENIDKEINKFEETIHHYYSPAVELFNAPGCIGQICQIFGKPTVFLANFSGLKKSENAVPISRAETVVIFNNLDDRQEYVSFIPFLGKSIRIKGQWKNGQLRVTLPSFDRGAIVMLE